MAFKKGKKGKDKDEDKKKKKKKGKKSKRKKFTYAAPEGLKGFFLVILCRTGKDGLITDVEAERYKGKIDNPKAKVVRLSETDPKVLASIAARLGATSYVTNPAKRLPPKTVFKMICRVGVNKDGNLRFSVREIKMISDSVKKTLNKKDDRYRRLRKCARIMPGALMKMNPEFPKIKKEKKGKKDDDE